MALDQFKLRLKIVFRRDREIDLILPLNKDNADCINFSSFQLRFYKFTL